MGLEVAILILLVGVVALFLGAELSLSSAEKVGRLLGMPPLLVGLIIIALGTSLPEFFVSHLAAWSGRGQIALGNIVGSNISNLLLVLGTAILIQKIWVRRKEMLHQVALHLLLSVLLGAVLLLDHLSLVSCLVLFAFLGGYLLYTYRDMKRSKGRWKTGQEQERSSVVLLSVKLLLGFLLLYAGGEALVRGGSELGRSLGISEYVVSVIFIALGTSLPEWITSLLIVVKGKDLDLVVGNVIGSNIFNVAFVLASLVFYRIEFQQTFIVEIAALLFSSLCLLVFSYKKWALNRVLGILFIGIYGAMAYYWSASYVQ